ncbi:hypothetical protein EMIHUDRAFT_455963, partial [Emiliania huxleyi CCMP1516]|uniref:Uncharacterized protein n=2 Tax=Emiliania huxleyi TaxID=2903 RepID=A0A0D3KAL3_EMIH1
MSRCRCTARRKKIGEGAGSTPLVVALDGSALMLDPAAAAARLTSLDEHARLGRADIGVLGAATAAAFTGSVMGGWRDGDAGMLERREAIDLAESELDSALGEIAEAEQRSEPVALGPWLKRYFALARRSECGFSPFMVLLLLQCVESQSVEAASVYIASRALGRLNLARQAEERALGVPAAIELDRAGPVGDHLRHVAAHTVF